MILGLFVTTLGIAMSAKAGLGTTPQATLPYVLSLGLPLTLGFWTLVVNTVLIVWRNFLLLYGMIQNISNFLSEGKHPVVSKNCIVIFIPLQKISGRQCVVITNRHRETGNSCLDNYFE